MPILSRAAEQELAPAPVRAEGKADRPVRVLLLATGAVTLAVQVRLLLLWGRKYTTEDGALLWYAARELAAGRIHQPSFYGQSYGTVLEAVPALVVHALSPLGRPASQAVATLALFLGAWLALAVAAARRGRVGVAAVALALPAVFSVEYQLVSAAPRGFAVAVLACGLAGAILAATPAGGLPGWRRLVAFAACASLAAAWDASTLLVGGPLTVWALLACRRSPRRLIAIGAGLVPGAAWAAGTALYYRAHPDENLYARGGFGVDLVVLRHNLRHLDRFVSFYRPELWRWWLLPVAALLGLLGVLATRAARDRSLPTAAAAATFLLLLVAALAAPKSLNSNDQAYLSSARFFLPVPLAAIALVLVCVPRPRPRAAGLGRLALPVTVLVGAGLVATAAVQSVPTLPDRLDHLRAAALASKEGVEVRTVAAVADRCRRLADLAEAAGTDLVVFSKDLVATYACPALTGGAIETLHPAFERRTWRLRDELARQRTSVLVADVPATWCDGVPEATASCTRVRSGSEVDSAVRFARQPTLLALKQLGLPIQRFRADPRLLRPLVCTSSARPVGAAPPTPPAPAPDEPLRADLTVDLAQRVSDGQEPIGARVTVINTGTATWPSESTPIGRVRLGVHLLDRDGRVVEWDYLHAALGLPSFQKVAPGRTVRLDVELPAPPQGKYVLEFDLVSEGVTWFAERGSPTVRIPVETRCLADGS